MPISALPLDPVLAVARERLSRDARARGIDSLSIETDREDLLVVNRANRDSWFEPLPVASSWPTIWVAGRDADGDVVATYEAALVDCEDVSLGARLADMSIFRAAPIAGEWCVCESDAAHAIEGRVAWMLSGWLKPSRARGRGGAFHTMGRILRLSVAALWAPDWLVGFVEPEVAPMWRRGAGPCVVADRPEIEFNQAGVGPLALHLGYFTGTAAEAELLALAGEDVSAGAA